MAQQYFLIAIGGTGMRCLEAFVHLCGIGMMDNMDINVLAIDTDFNNGNLDRTKRLLENYIQIKESGSNKNQNAYSDTFFSAKLNFYYFSPEYQGESRNFRTISKISRLGEEASRHNQWLADLLLSPDAQQFPLGHGYRAQTHLGSHLMYHAILDEMRQINDGRPDSPHGLSKFLEKVSSAGEDPKVFIMGSIFGGTGASSIPVIPKALRDARKQVDNQAEMPIGIMYGATLLTSYFKFSKPKGSQLEREILIADSDRFGLNCQAALKFYNEDLTVTNAYKRMYHIGWPSLAFDYDDSELKVRQDRVGDKVLTGGQEQRNPSHIIEMLCAFAALHFFKDKTLKPISPLQHLYKSLPINSETKLPVFAFEDFVGVESSQINRFKRKLSAFVAMAMMVQNDFGGKMENFISGMSSSGEHHVENYRGIDELEYKALNRFLTDFIYELQENSVLSNWFQQIQQSSEISNLLQFNREIFTTDRKSLQKANYGKVWENSSYQFPSSRRGLFFKSGPYDRFANAFKLVKENKLEPDNEVEKQLEKLLNHIYKTMNHLHNIPK